MLELETLMGATFLEGDDGTKSDPVPPLGLCASAALYGAGALLLLLTTQAVIPALVSATGAEPVLMWFIAASTILFAPLLLIAALLLHRERPLRRRLWGARLRFRAMNAGD